jgi:hypothetical protein
MALCWSIATHHMLTSFIKHILNPIFIEFLNVICTKEPTQIEIDHVFSYCYIS